ncbi:AT-hook motif nuclear-localized protein 9-like [Carica papaya]|uniref:AT-hook motif nuclear-localized protein 9-like n=1 Tax=Carica papaya TaxID=3649 RepID=UPI000B8C9136|nr:AT-hook motif nuclear-localized protein 9-like [Carica papaya]
MEDDKGMPDLVQQEGESKKDEVSTTNTLKRSRGRPKGSGRLQLLANAGGLPFATAGRSFTPHILTIPVGEDVASKGFFEILSLSGAITGDDNGRQTGSLSVSLSHPDGVVFGGRVTGPLVAALPVQLVLGTFKRNATRSRKRKNPGGPSTKPSPDGNLEMERQTPDINLTITDRRKLVTQDGNINSRNHDRSGGSSSLKDENVSSGDTVPMMIRGSS